MNIELKEVNVTLKDALLTGKISTAEFLTKLLQADQANPKRGPALDNIALLTDEVVRVRFEQDKEHKFDYYNLLSISYLHAGQLCPDPHSPETIHYFEQSLRAAQAAGGDLKYNDWKIYIQGLIAYSKHDWSMLERMHVALEAGPNKDALSSLLIAQNSSKV